MLRKTLLIPGFFVLRFPKATDTPEDRNNPVLLYNKMELGDLNANFSLEIESKVLAVKRARALCPSSLSPSLLLLICIPLRCLFVTCPEAVQLELLRRQDNEHSQHQRSRHGESHKLRPQLFPETQRDIGQPHKEVCFVCFLFVFFFCRLPCVGGSVLHRQKRLACLRASLNIRAPLAGTCRTTWCGAFP